MVGCVNIKPVGGGGGGFVSTCLVVMWCDTHMGHSPYMQDTRQWVKRGFHSIDTGLPTLWLLHFLDFFSTAGIFKSNDVNFKRESVDLESEEKQV